MVWLKMPKIIGTRKKFLMIKNRTVQGLSFFVMKTIVEYDSKSKYIFGIKALIKISFSTNFDWNLLLNNFLTNNFLGKLFDQEYIEH